MRADRRKNGRLRKYHYSKIQNAGDCVARTGVREIGFKFGSLPHDPGGITCMLELVEPIDLWIEGLLVRDLPESLCCVLVQDTLSVA